MTDKDLTDFKEVKKRINEENEIITDIVKEVAKRTKEAISFQNKVDEIAKTNEFITNSINDVPDRCISNMTETDYVIFVNPYREWIPIEGTLTAVQDSLKSESRDIITLGSTATVLSSTSSMLASSISVNISKKPDLYPRSARYIQKFSEEEEIKKAINSIRLELPKIVPNILPDFNIFIEKFQALKDNSSRNTELIGFRTTMFHKLIYAFAEANNVSSNAYSRKQQISYFATKNTTPPRINEVEVNEAKSLWDELSAQDTASVKIGNVSDRDMELLYIKILRILNSLLTIRIAYYQ